MGFHNRGQKNKCNSIDPSKGGSFIVSAVTFWEILIDSMIKHNAKHIRKSFRSLDYMVWLPSTADLEIFSEIPDEKLKLLI